MVQQTRNFGREFEEEVKNFLEDKLNFEDVKGGPGFHIAPPGESNQTDVCGRYGEVLLVFQCKASGRKTKKNFREQILAMRERSKIVLANYKRIPEYSKCRFVLFVFITKKIFVPLENKKLLEEGNPKIWYADEHMLKYYSDLHDKIGEYATYNFLADFGVRPPENEQLKAIALRTKIGKHNVYSFYIRPKQLLKFAYVARRRSNKENFYQRMLEKSRIKNIQSFLDSGGIFPTNIIISIRKGETSFNKLPSQQPSEQDRLTHPKHVEIGLLTIKNCYSACWIVDGQHRLYAFAGSKSNCMVPCIAFDDIEFKEERKFFLEINREQKPIQADLIWDLEGQAHPETKRGKISNVVRKLNFREPFFDKIYIPLYGAKTGKPVNMAAFCLGILNSRITERITPNSIGKENPLFIENSWTMVNRTSGVIERYFKVILNSLKEEHEKFILGNAGVPIMLYLLEPIIARIGRIPSLRDFEKYANPIKKFFEENYPKLDDIRKLKVETTSEGSRRDLAKELGLIVRRENRDNAFWPTMEKSEFIQEIVEMERRLGKLISSQLSKITVSWEKQRIPPTILIGARKKALVDGTDLDENFDLGEEMQIIMQNDNWSQIFFSIFIRKRAFLNKDELKLAFQYLSKIRNPALHGKSTIPTKGDLDQCGIYLQKFDTAISEISPESTND